MVPHRRDEHDAGVSPSVLSAHSEAMLLPDESDRELLKSFGPEEPSPITELEEEPPWIADFLAQYRLVFGPSSRVVPAAQSPVEPVRTRLDSTREDPKVISQPVKTNPDAPDIAEGSLPRVASSTQPSEEGFAGSRIALQPESNWRYIAIGVLISALLPTGILVWGRYQLNGQPPVITTQRPAAEIPAPRTVVVPGPQNGYTTPAKLPDSVLNPISAVLGGKRPSLGFSPLPKVADRRNAGLGSSLANFNVKVEARPDDWNFGDFSAIPLTALVPTRPEFPRGLPVRRVQPVYPAEAMARQLQGRVILQADIADDGKVEAVTVISGDPLLAQAAAAAVGQWIYPPSPALGRQQRISISFKAR
jgi:TonB family protein